MTDIGFHVLKKAIYKKKIVGKRKKEFENFSKRKESSIKLKICYQGLNIKIIFFFFLFLPYRHFLQVFFLLFRHFSIFFLQDISQVFRSNISFPAALFFLLLDATITVDCFFSFIYLLRPKSIFHSIVKKKVFNDFRFGCLRLFFYVFKPRFYFMLF